MADTLFINAGVFDGYSGALLEGRAILVKNGVIQAISAENPGSRDHSTIIDLKGMTLMPGLIDCHVHVVANLAHLGLNAQLPDSLVAARAGRILKQMIDQGVTTVRDAGGADIGLQEAVAEGTFIGPHLNICGKALIQTGGHCDFRGRYDNRDAAWIGGRLGSLGRVCDGVDAVRRAVREEIKAGANWIKVMANGGVASPTDPIHFLGFSVAELEAMVEEATNAGTYVGAHLYTDNAIQRAVTLGVRTVEHANFVKAPTAALMAERGAIACPTLVINKAVREEGSRHGVPAWALPKMHEVWEAALQSLEIMHSAGVEMAYSTDLIGPWHDRYGDELVIRSQVLPNSDLLRSATSIAAKVLQMEGEVGCIRVGARADLIVVDGNPLENIALLANGGAHIPLVMKSGEIVKNMLNAS